MPKEPTDPRDFLRRRMERDNRAENWSAHDVLAEAERMVDPDTKIVVATIVQQEDGSMFVEHLCANLDVLQMIGLMEMLKLQTVVDSQEEV